MKNTFCAAALILFALISCKLPGKKSDDTLTHFDLSEPQKFVMPGSLNEISGISFYKGKSDTVYAIQDEEGRVFRLAWNVKKQYNSKFGKKGDYEDVSILKEKIIVLKSNGALYSFPFSDAVYEELDSVQEWKQLLPEGEYEGMYGDEASGKLYVICKNCKEDDNHNTVSGYILQAGDSIYSMGVFSIDVNQIKAYTGKVKRGFRPSAIARNPVTNEWYILSSVNKLLIVTDANWKITAATPLNGNIFNQPEGICFDAGGNMYISNEGDDLSEGNILKFTIKAGNTNTQ